MILLTLSTPGWRITIRHALKLMLIFATVQKYGKFVRGFEFTGSNSCILVVISLQLVNEFSTT